MTNTTLHLGNTPVWVNEAQPSGEYVQLLGETYYRIAHVDQMPPFFMSLVSGADHWLFIASNGGLTAGRANADSALFPYETEDKIIAHREQTGGKTMMQVTVNGRTHLWLPFSNQYTRLYHRERHLYKNIPGNKLIFEEVNHDLGLTLRVAWRTGDRFGFIRTCWLRNDSDQTRQVSLLDGLQNLLPYGATNALQSSMSSLLHAYKRSELDPESGLGIFALSATLTDQAEPSESLQATVAWQVGLENPVHLLCVDQVAAFGDGRSLIPEQDSCGKAGAYLVNATLTLPPGESHRWHIVADVNQDSAAITRLVHCLRQARPAIERQLEADIAENTAVLQRYVAAADGLQHTAQATTTAHHFANVMFNIMRGGILADGYQVERRDLLNFMQTRSRALLAAQADWFAALPAHLPIGELYARAAANGRPDLIRLCYEYLPLAFSRRHGDPSRPWNHFSINLKQPDGSPRLDYQGNWRDIFQNWEPLTLAFPGYIDGVIAKFLNATTADGYNPYRVTRDGIEWEIPEPHNPWANIGYWSDHQIIYLQKLLEIAEQSAPGVLSRLGQRPIFAYANVPYRLKPYADMLADWSNTITFDWEQERVIATAVAQFGTDGRLHRSADGQVIHATLTEKLLTLLLAKLTNLVPDGGIWMNTQRPEWNDANNALVGKGLSVVTAAYLRRFIAFWQNQLAGAEDESFAVNTAVATLFAAVQTTLCAHQPHLQSGFTNQARRAIMDELGAAATAYRADIYANGLPETQVALSGQSVSDLLALAQSYVEQTLRANRRDDGLYHAYNILRLADGETAVDHLYPMLEGQVAILSSGLLAPDEALALLRSLRHSDLYRADQHSYMLYPNRRLPGFRHKNNVPAARVAGRQLVAALAKNGDRRLLVQDEAGDFHFNGRFRNANDARRVLDMLAQEPAYAELVTAEGQSILDLFEETFNHRAFTGRSGTFFAYEGLGSIYWHMVAKLLLATQECYVQAVHDGADTAVTNALAAAYFDIRSGLGYHKSPTVYGAFPTDPYSHTPLGRGAQQPGMTGQVKEEILTRWGELGVFVRNGTLHFAPTLLDPDEFSSAPGDFCYIDLTGQRQSLPLPAGSLAFTFCQTPIVYTRSSEAQIEVMYGDGRSACISAMALDTTTSHHILSRNGLVKWVHVRR
ncbi:MAG: hypothetical protein IAE79_08415 [Anaerolinea sp.]|nr:hypothetical protein [Anaerolinea sp.]